MALALVGGAFLSSFLNVLFDRMASPTSIGFFKTGRIIAAQLRKLKISLNTVYAVLDNAEHTQTASPAVKSWLDELRDAACKAVDLLDLIEYQAAATAEVEAAGQETITDQMVEIIETLEYLKQQIVFLGLRDGGRKDASSKREATTPVVVESDVVGRDADKEAIFKLLQKNDDVIPLVGMGGIGKTTLAQLVYNDSRAIKLFDCRAWACVSENYDGFKIKREILQIVNNSKEGDGFASTQIDEQLKQSLKDKTYLIVLDDMWNDSYADWDKLLTPLKSGAAGSQIIVTTRNQRVASTTSNGSGYQLSVLNEDYCWELFERHAFNHKTPGDEKFALIRKKIVRKCKGLPLAAKMVGGLLRHKQEVAEWEEVLKSNIWDLQKDEILPSLRLSYQHLPPHLKPCFAYCAIFPKDYYLDKEEIIRLWMAQGFLTQPVRAKKLEELGEECFDELVSRSFLQESRERWSGRQSLFLMHDLTNDLARQILGEFLAIIEQNDHCELNAKTRHVSLVASEIVCSKIHESISQVPVMNSFLIFRRRGRYENLEDLDEIVRVDLEEIVDDLLHNNIAHFRSLRVLGLSDFNGLVKLPNSIENLKLLRYLNLAETDLESLPESLCSLYHLQTLVLFGCEKLVELPENIGALINMHYLDTRCTTALRQMPAGIGNLKDLRILGKFIVGNQNGLDINELGKLEHLRGELSISQLQNAVQHEEKVLRNKRFLENLGLEWSRTTDDSMLAKNILGQLQPHTSVKEIKIIGYGGTEFADWVGDSTYTSMVSLKLRGCKNCISLPPLGQLSSLKYLSISEFDAVEEVGAEFCGISKTPFKALETLEIIGMRQLEGWIIFEGNNSDKCECFAKLKRLTLQDCPKLASIKTSEAPH